MPFRHSPDYLSISHAAAAAFVAVRLRHFGLFKRLPFLYTYLLIVASCDLLASVLLDKSKVYLWVYLISTPILWLAASLGVREMYGLIFRDYPGLQTAGRWALYLALTLSLAVSLVIGDVFWRGGSPNSRRLFYELVLDRSVDTSLAVVIIILMLFLSRYPLRLDRNTKIASAFFSTIFLAQAAVRLVDSVSPRLIARYADYPEVGFTALCLLGWGFMIQPVTHSIPVPAAVNKPREAELLQQLESLNQILTRSARR